MYDVTDSLSFSKVKKMLEMKQNHKNVVLIGNKADLQPHFDKKIVQEICEKYNIENFEVNSNDKSNVQQVMMTILQGL